MATAYRRNCEHLAPWDPVRTEGFYTTSGQQLTLEQRLGPVEDRQAAAWVLEYDGDVVGRVNLNQPRVRGAAQRDPGLLGGPRPPTQGLAVAADEHACAEALKLLLIAGAWREHHLYQRILHDDTG